MCRDEIPAAPPAAFPNPSSCSPSGIPPVRSSHAAGIFTIPSSAGKTRKGTPALAATSCTRTATSSLTAGFLKKLPALRQSGSPSTSNIPLLRRMLRTAAAVSAKVGAVGPVGKMRLQIPVGNQRRAVFAQPVINARDNESPAIRRIEPALADTRIRTPRSRTPQICARADQTPAPARSTEAASCPYAPTFCTGVPPTVPGIPARHSIPANSAPVVCCTQCSQDSPAATRNSSPSRSNALQPQMQHEPRKPPIGNRAHCCRRPAQTAARLVRAPTRRPPQHRPRSPPPQTTAPARRCQKSSMGPRSCSSLICIGSRLHCAGLARR